MIEIPDRIEPAYLSEAILCDLVSLSTDLVVAPAKLPGRLPPAAAAELAGLVRIMNCCYSSLIEGHRTRPVDIEKVIASARPEKRPLLQEAKAHVAVEKHLDEAYLACALGTPTSVEFVKDLHKILCDERPIDLRISTFGDRTVAIVPDAFRAQPEEDIALGRHQPPSSHWVADFMDHSERRFAVASRSLTQRIESIRRRPLMFEQWVTEKVHAKSYGTENPLASFTHRNSHHPRNSGWACSRPSLKPKSLRLQTNVR